MSSQIISSSSITGILLHLCCCSETASSLQLMYPFNKTYVDEAISVQSHWRRKKKEEIFMCFNPIFTLMYFRRTSGLCVQHNLGAFLKTRPCICVLVDEWNICHCSTAPIQSLHLAKYYFIKNAPSWDLCIKVSYQQVVVKDEEKPNYWRLRQQNITDVELFLFSKIRQQLIRNFSKIFKDTCALKGEERCCSSSRKTNIHPPVLHITLTHFELSKLKQSKSTLIKKPAWAAILILLLCEKG